MPEVFISYAWADNQVIDDVTHEIAAPIDHFLKLFSHVKTTVRGEQFDSDFFFLDRTTIPPGGGIPDTIKTALADCPVMLAFYSPSYFRSAACFGEWQEFKRLSDVDPGKRLIIPVEVRKIDLDRLRPWIDDGVEGWFNELVTAGGLKRNIHSSMLLNRDTKDLAEAVDVLIDTIESHLLEIQGSEGDRRTASNTLVIEKHLVGSSWGSEVLQELEARAGELKYHRIDPVCVIYAGGTVGMIHQEESDVLHADFEMAPNTAAIVKYLRPRISGLPFDIHFLSLAQTIDSANITASDWVSLATLIQEQLKRYQGFVVLHGTNTLAYTASALSFLLRDVIDRPVILTGAEVPISVPNTDALHNVENAIRAAAWQAYNGPMRVPEVCIYWNNQLHRGNRVTKKQASHRESGYHTPNMPVPLAALSNEKLSVDHTQLLARGAIPEQPEVAGSVAALSRVKVGVMFIHPDMDFDDLESKYPSSLDGLLLLSYGSGNVPEDARFIACIRRLVGAGTAVANITQCPYGRVELKLFETSATLFDLGVIDGYDMTLEAAYTKLLWALAQLDNRRGRGAQDSIRQTFQRNQAGEMSASIYTVSFGGSDSFDPSVIGDEFLVSDASHFDAKVDRYDIAEVFVRIEGLRFPKGVTSGKLRVLYGSPREEAPEAWEPRLLAEFTKTFTAAELAEGFIHKNLEITHPFRKCFNNDNFQVSVGVEGVSGFSFSSLRLVLYTITSGRP